LTRATRSLGCPLEEPFMVLSFLELCIIQELKMTDRGLVDAKEFRHAPLCV
jgi:adenine deaminase